MNIKITDNRKEMANIGRNLARMSRADITSEKYRDYLKELNIFYSRYYDRVGGESKEEAFYAWLYDFWMYGVNMREEYFYDFPHKTHEQKAEYITRSNRFRYYELLNDQEDSLIIKHKYKTYEVFHNYFFREVIEIREEKDYELFSDFAGRHSCFIVKPDNLGLGMGIHIVDSRKKDKKLLFDNFLREIAENVPKSEENESSIVLEELIQQDMSFAKLYPKAVNIIRITTILTEGETRFLDAWLRVGMNGYNITAANLAEIYCGVDINTGIVSTEGYTELFGVYKTHPDTGIRFKGYKIPRWEELLRVTTEMSQILPTVRYIGWDMALTDKGWVLVEGNENGEFLGQLVFGKPYKNMVNKMAGIQNEDGFWWEKRPHWV